MSKTKLPRIEKINYSEAGNHEHNENNIVLSCGTGSGLTLPLGRGGNGNGYYQRPALVVGTVNIDTSGMHKPTVKIDLSSIINMRVKSECGGYLLGIIFQLSKSCNNGVKLPLGTWIFEEEVEVYLEAPGPDCVEIDLMKSFEFKWCECNECPGCCTYLIEIIDFASDYVTSASITNVAINAMAVSS